MYWGGSEKCFYFCAFICDKLMFLMKNKIVLFITACFTFVLSSCLKSDEYPSVEYIKNCQIKSFSLSNDSVAGLSDVKFTIDQLTGQIFNIDSMPYGTKIKNVVCKVEYVSSYSLQGVEVSPDAFADSTYYWNGTDSINFSKSVRFLVHAYDGLATKVYRAQVNIHQVVPDSMVWGKYADPMVDIALKEQKVVPYEYNGSESYFMYVKPAQSGKPYQVYQTSVADPKNWKLLSLSGLPSDGVRLSQITEYNGALYVPTTGGTLYTSVDGLDWAAVENAPSVKYIFGEVKEGTKQSSALATVADQDGTLTFYAMNKSGEWLSGNAVPALFPLTGFGSIQFGAMYHEYLLIAQGRDKDNGLTNTSWATMDGKTWALMGSPSQSGLTKREGVMMANYADKFFLIGGLDASGKGLKDIYNSIDNGITWSKVDTMVVLPADYVGRGFSSIVVDKQNFVNIFGGKTAPGSNELNQLWRGRINRLVPKQ